MQFVDDIGVLCFALGTAFDEMRVIGRQVVVAVREHVGIALRPYPDGDQRADEREHRARAECSVHASAGADPARERIGDKPAHMAERNAGRWINMQRRLECRNVRNSPVCARKRNVS